MPNTIITVKDIAREALPILRDNLVAPRLFYNDYSKEFAKKGDTIKVTRPVEFSVDEFDGSINIQEIVEDFVMLKIDKIADVSFAATEKELSLSIEDFKNQYLQSAMLAIAEKINNDGLEMYKWVPYFVGASGTTPGTLEDFALANKMLNLNRAPVSPRNGVWGPEATAEFQQLDSLVEVDKAGSNLALREGQIGRVFGINNYMSQAVKLHTAGGFSALADVTAAATVVSAASDATTNLAYTPVELTSAAGVSTAKLLKGDLLKLEDDSGNTYNVTVIEDTAVAVAGVVTAKVHPAIIADDLTDTAVTFPDVTTGAHEANLVFNPKAFAFVTRPLHVPSNANSYVTSFEGLSLRVTQAYDIDTKVETISIDILYGYAPLYPKLAVRVLG